MINVIYDIMINMKIMPLYYILLVSLCNYILSLKATFNLILLTLSNIYVSNNFMKLILVHNYVFKVITILNLVHIY